MSLDHTRHQAQDLIGLKNVTRGNSLGHPHKIQFDYNAGFPVWLASSTWGIPKHML